MDLELRPATDDELPRFHRAAATAFGNIPTADELGDWGTGLEAERTLAAFDDDEIVATAGAYTFGLTVPGGARVPTAGVTIVGVRPTHRRRGLLTRMMDEQLDDVTRRDEPIAVLTASESSIYGRFGYGLATFNTWWRLPTEGTTFASPSTAEGRVRLVDRDAAPAIAGRVFDAAATSRVGEVSRGEAYWARVYRERRGPASPDSDGAPFFTVVHENASGEPDAFARYAITSAWPHGLAANVLRVFELHATDPEGEAALWAYLTSVDLVATVKADDRPADEPLRWRLTEPRRLQVDQLTDHLWVRVVDVGAALSARTYAVADALVLELVDPFRPVNNGRWLVEGGPDGAACARTERDPDLVLSAPELGALYLGGVDASTLARAGRVRSDGPHALARADRFFHTHPLPWCSTHF
jgi:predicted acetyltransferase